MKVCSKCSTSKNLEEFSKSSKSNDGHQRWCKLCVKTYEANRYQAGDNARKIKNFRDRRDRHRKMMWELLCRSACADCGEDDPEVLEFDHRGDSKKSHDISAMVGNHKWETILEEIEKCDVVCANCHRRRTNRQFGRWRALAVRK